MVRTFLGIVQSMSHSRLNILDMNVQTKKVSFSLFGRGEFTRTNFCRILNDDMRCTWLVTGRIIAIEILVLHTSVSWPPESEYIHPFHVNQYDSLRVSIHNLLTFPVMLVQSYTCVSYSRWSSDNQKVSIQILLTIYFTYWSSTYSIPTTVTFVDPTMVRRPINVGVHSNAGLLRVLLTEYFQPWT